MIKNIILIFLLIIFQNTALCQNFQWVDSQGGHTDDFANAVVADKDGNIYVTGHVGPSMNFANTPLDWGVFITKYSPEGKILWVRNGIGFSADGIGIALDSKNNVYVTGNMLNYGVTFNGILLRGLGSWGPSEQSFLVKYTSDGDWVWGKNIAGTKTESITTVGAMTIDKNDNIYLTGRFSSQLDLGDIGTLTGQSDIFLIKYNADGVPLWSKSAGGPSRDDIGHAVAVNDKGQVYISGTVFPFNAQFNNIPLQNVVGNHTSFVAKYEANGDFLWVNASSHNSSGEWARVNGMVIENNNIYVTGIYAGSMISNNQKLVSPNTITFLLKLNENGKTEWLKNVGVTGDNNSPWIKPITSDNEGGIYLTGSFFQEATFDNIKINGNVLNTLTLDIFLAKYNDAGIAQWAHMFGGNRKDYGAGLHIDDKNNIILVGSYDSGIAHFGSISVNNKSGNDDSDIFVAKMANSAPNICTNINASIKSPTDTTICEGGLVKMSLKTDTSVPVLWFFNKNIIPDERSSTLNVNKSGLYQVIIYPNTVCADTISRIINITEVSFPQQLIMPDNDTFICEGNILTLTAPTSQNYSYEWFKNSLLIPNETNYKLAVSEPGQYFVKIKNQFSCEILSKKINVQQIDRPINFLLDSIDICEGQTLTISPKNLVGNWNYNWSSGENTPNIQINAAGTYRLTLSNNSCSYTEELKVSRILPLLIPNIITPNGDKLNDVLLISNLRENSALTIYNRWGKKVFWTEKYENNWNAENLPSGVYYYQLENKPLCNEKSNYKGWVEVIR